MSGLEVFWLRVTGRGALAAEMERSHERMMSVRRTAADLWLKAGGHIPYSNGGLIHEFMVTHPDTRRKFERIAEAIIDGEQA
jgi:hypothetical protein